MIRVEQINGKVYLIAEDYCQEITKENCKDVNVELHEAGKLIRKLFEK